MGREMIGRHRMKYLDIETWNRSQHFHLFKDMDYPYFNLCANIDITNLRHFLQLHQQSFFKTMVCLTSKVANDIDEFRYRIRADRVVIHEQVDPSFTVLTTADVFSFCTVRYQADMVKLYQEIEAQMAALQGQISLGDEPGRDDLLYITSIPWVSFTSLSHPVHLHPVDSIPRIAWGKFFAESGMIKLPFSIQAHHALMDGLHAGRYFQELQELVADPQALLVK
jgi:chloramphenicol O-acetyltransferase type A